MNNFKSFLLNEERSYLGHKVGDVLTSLQDLVNDLENLGSRHVARLSEEIVNQIRKILHSQWTPKYFEHLRQLQKVAVAVQKTIDEKGDLDEVLPAAMQALQSLSGKLGVKVNNLQAPPERDGGEDVEQDDFQLTGDGKPNPPPQGNPPQGNPPQGNPNELQNLFR